MTALVASSGAMPTSGNATRKISSADDQIGNQERDADQERRQAQPAAGLQVDLEVVEADDAQHRRAEEERHQPDEERVEGDDVLGPEPEEDPDADRRRSR